MAFETDALEILTGKHVGVLGTILAAGSPGLACVWYGFDGEDIIIATPAGRRKDKNVRNDPRVSFLVDASDHAQPIGGYKGVEVRGVAEMEPDPDGALRRQIVGRYLDPIPPEFEQRITEEERVIIRIRASRVRVWDFSRGRR
ncbi:MAG: PPOX class F420-dependent oxidoreductase [Dehalococcoidia bacterium]